METNKNVVNEYKDVLSQVREKFTLMQQEIDKQKDVTSIVQNALLDQHVKKNEKDVLLNDARREYTKERVKRQSLEKELEELRKENQLMKEQYGDKAITNSKKPVLSREDMVNQFVLKTKLELKYAKTGEKKLDALGRERTTFVVKEKALKHDFLMTNVNERDIQGKQHKYENQIITMYRARHIENIKDAFESGKVNLKAAQKMGVETLVKPFTKLYESNRSKLKESLMNYVVETDYKKAIQGERQPYRSKTVNLEKVNKMVFDREASIQKLNAEPQSKLISRSLVYATKEVGAAIKAGFTKYITPGLTEFVQKKKERFQEIKQDVAKQKEQNRTKDNDRAM